MPGNKGANEVRKSFPLFTGPWLRFGRDRSRARTLRTTLEGRLISPPNLPIR